MLLRAKIKFILPVAVVLAVVMFYLYAVLNGASYSEGIAVRYFIDPEEAAEEFSLPIVRVTEEDLAGAPRLKKMLEVALEQEFLPYPDGFAVLDAELNSYRINRDDDSINVRIGMSPGDLAEFQDWYSENLNSSYIEYREKIFAIGFWIA